ncbi:High affinity Ca2+/Mn2+ P-type ATPase-like protein [Actinomortierella wolfii]|nr:High affinity Ca2+/Mn2+ P-type ATPase-like protein [Actinomortierella wolfii]
MTSPAAPSHHTPSATFARQTPEETGIKLETDLTRGLTTQEANRRRLLHGLNEFDVEDDEKLYVKFLKSFYENPLILLLLASAIVSLFMGQKDDAISITLLSVTCPGGVAPSGRERLVDNASRIFLNIKQDPWETLPQLLPSC